LSSVTLSSGICGGNNFIGGVYILDKYLVRV